MLERITQNPNRVAIYLTALGDVLAVALIIAADLQSEEVIGVLTGVAAVNAKVLTWLKGWQKMETAEYQRRLMQAQRDGEAELAAKVGGVPGRSRVNLPR